MSNADRFTAKLVQQLRFLHRSCLLFDLGYSDEAVRIATSLRVLLYDKPSDPPNRGSILKHLGATDIRLKTTCASISAGNGTFLFDGYMHLPGNIFPWADYLEPNLIELDVPSWWTQVIFISGGHRIRRQDLILSAANKDGGAHVDPSLTAEYEAAIGMWLKVTHDDDGGTQKILLDKNHLLALRRFGLEVLNSRELLSLANAGSAGDIEADHLVRVTEADLPVFNRATDISMHRLRGDSLASNAEFAEAAKAYGRAIELLDEIRIALLLGQGSTLVRAGQHQAATTAYEAVLACEPANAAALYGAGFALKEAGDLERAEPLLSAAVSGHSDHVPAHLSLAELQVRRGKHERALELYERVLLLDPGNQIAANNRAAVIEELAGGAVCYEQSPWDGLSHREEDSKSPAS